MKIIFLDMDGVCNSDDFFNEPGEPNYGKFQSMDFGAGQLDPKSIANLNMLIAATGAKIVISSSWRHIWQFDEMQQMLASKGFKYPDAIIDQTPESIGGFRGKEVQDWLELHDERKRIDDDAMPVQSYVILDDNNDFTTEQQQHFVHTNPKHGLTQQDVKKAIAILNGGLHL